MKVLKNLFGLNKKISASEIALKDENGIVNLLDNFMFERFSFSQKEKVAGTWLNDEVLYKKTIVVPSLPNTGYVKISHNINNFKEGFFDITHSYTQQSNGYRAPMPYINPSDYARSIFLYDLDSTSFTINVGSLDRSSWSGIVTLLYTKN